VSILSGNAISTSTYQSSEWGSCGRNTLTSLAKAVASAQSPLYGAVWTGPFFFFLKKNPYSVISAYKGHVRGSQQQLYIHARPPTFQPSCRLIMYIGETRQAAGQDHSAYLLTTYIIYVAPYDSSLGKPCKE
jgi:hypothetical protein